MRTYLPMKQVVEPSLSEVEVKQYLHEVIEEVRKGKTQNGNK